MVITIEREFGAGGRSVGRVVGRRLPGARLLEGELVGEVTRRVGLGEAEVERTDEWPEPIVNRLVDRMKYLAPGMMPPWQPPGHERAARVVVAMARLSGRQRDADHPA